MMTTQEIQDTLRRQGFIELNKEIKSLKSLLTISHPVKAYETNSPNILAAVLRCGNEALLVILLDKAHLGVPTITNVTQQDTQQNSSLVRMVLPIPTGLKVTTVQDMYGSVPVSQWNFENGQLAINHEMTNSAEVLRIDVKYVK